MGERLNIVECKTTQWADAEAPKTLREVGVERVVGRRIVGWSPYYGSYGMGGPGFFGLKLEGNERWPMDHLVLILWGACEWLLLDGVWVEAGSEKDQRQRPLYSQRTEMEWDEVTPRLVGGLIEGFTLDDESSRHLIGNGDDKHILELPQDKTGLPLHGIHESAHGRAGINWQSRRWNPAESVADAWVICDGYLYC